MQIINLERENACMGPQDNADGKQHSTLEFVARSQAEPSPRGLRLGPRPDHMHHMLLFDACRSLQQSSLIGLQRYENDTLHRILTVASYCTLVLEYLTLVDDPLLCHGDLTDLVDLLLEVADAAVTADLDGETVPTLSGLYCNRKTRHAHGVRQRRSARHRVISNRGRFSELQELQRSQSLRYWSLLIDNVYGVGFLGATLYRGLLAECTGTITGAPR